VGPFAQVITKPVFTLTFGRGWPSVPAVYDKLYRKLVRAQRQGGIVVTTPSAIKSIVNKVGRWGGVGGGGGVIPHSCVANNTTNTSVANTNHQYVELLNAVASAPLRRLSKSKAAEDALRVEKLEDMSAAADVIAKIIDLWSERQRGVLLLDEVGKNSNPTTPLPVPRKHDPV
jgi:hypothetical protein